MTYGRTVGKALDKFHIDRDTWPELAADRAAWRDTLRLGYPAIRRSKRIAQHGRAELPEALRRKPRRAAVRGWGGGSAMLTCCGAPFSLLGSTYQEHSWPTHTPML